MRSDHHGVLWNLVSPSTGNPDPNPNSGVLWHCTLE